MPWFPANRRLLFRRLVQALVLFLFVAGSSRGWKVLQGDLSSSRLFGAVPLSDPYAVLQVLFTGTLIGSEELLGGFIVAVFFAAVGGRAFCAWVCPMNIVTDLAASLRRSFLSDVAQAPVVMSRNVRYWIMVVSLVLSAGLGIAAFEWVSPVAMLHRGLIFGMGAGWAVIAAVFLFDLVLVPQGFCGHVCPLGGFYALIGRASMVRIRHDADRCSRCMRCVSHCPEPQVLPMIGKKNAVVWSGECTNCGRCIDVCPDDAMRFAIRPSLRERKGGQEERP